MKHDVPPGSTVTVFATVAEISALDRGHVLSAAEEARIARFTHPEDARRFSAAHVLLRHLLSALFPNGPPGRWVVDVTRGRAPTVQDLDATVSLTHADGVVGAAVGLGGPCGVDAERADRHVTDELLAHALSPREQHELHSSSCGPPSSDMSHFFRCWTLKEAYVKALGIGLRTNPNELVFSWADGNPVLLTPPARFANRSFLFASLDLGFGHMGAVAVDTTRHRAEIVRLAPDKVLV